jgi:glycosyltransferase involved in cell wall biosynthesis
LVFSNPPILCWLAALMAVLRGQPYAAMIHDIYPDVLVQLAGFSEKHLFVRAWRWLNRQAYQRASVVLTLSPQMAANLERQFDSTRTTMGRVIVLPPWVDTDLIKPMAKEDNDFSRAYAQVGKVTVMYSGNMGLGHDIETMLKAAERLLGVTRLHFLFIGAGPKWSLVRDIRSQRQLSNVTLLPWQPEETLPWQLASADIGLVSLETELRGLALPSKVFYMMAAGAALVVLSAKSGDLEQIVEQGPCGEIVPPGDVDGLVNALQALAGDRETLTTRQWHARHAAEISYGRRANTQQFRACLTRVFPAMKGKLPTQSDAVPHDQLGQVDSHDGHVAGQS